MKKKIVDNDEDDFEETEISDDGFEKLFRTSKKPKKTECVRRNAIKKKYLLNQ